MTTVLIGIDGSGLATQAARSALALLGTDGTSITLARVISSPPLAALAVSSAAPGPVLFADPAVVDDTAVEEQASAELAEARRALGVPAETRLLRGEPGTELCALAKAERFDLLVVGTHGSGLVKEVVLGSVSRHVLHHAPCPVLVVREHASTAS